MPAHILRGRNVLAFLLILLLNTSYAQTTFTFNCTSSIQSFNFQGGDYKIECWGADGSMGTYYSGASPNSIDGGKGGYSVGYVTIASPVTWYVVVGAKGTNLLAGNNPGGFNGGGNSSSAAYQAGSGGGATHLATVTGLLSSLAGNQSAVKIVAGGGGGGGNQSLGGDGGGLVGVQPANSTQFSLRTAGGGGTQSSGGTCFSGGSGAGFGQGGTTTQNLAGGGGGGWYGGCTGDNSTAGGGGSGYIGGVNNGTTVANGQPGFIPNPDVSGNGFVIITRLCDVNVNASKNPICQGESLTLGTNAGSGILWSTGATTSSITVSPSSTTMYTVSGVSSSTSACTSTVTILVKVNPLPVLTLETFPPVFCAGAAGTVFASGAVSYSWSNSTTGSSTLVNPLISTVYTATGTNVFGCKNTETVMVNVNTNSLIVSPNTTICKGKTATLTAMGVNTALWSNGASFLTIQVAPTVNTIYAVTGQDGLGCTLSNTVSVNVASLPAIVITANKQTVCRGENVTLTANGGVSYVWDNNEITPAVTKTLMVNVPYQYSVTGTDASGCSSTAAITVNASACTGVQENEFNAVSVYPNPATSEITISATGNGSKSITVTDVTGRIVMVMKTDEALYTFNIQTLPSGVYHVRVVNGNNTNDAKFVKQ